AGALTVPASAVAALEYLHGSYGNAAWAGWSALVLAVLAAIAVSFRQRGHWLTAGLFAFATVAAWGFFVGALERWWGWLPSSSNPAFSGFHPGLLLLELLILGAALVFVSVAASTGRSSWAVLGTVGLILSAVHFAIEWTRVGFYFLPIVGGGASPGATRGWVPSLVFAVLGFLLVTLGLVVGRRRALLRTE